MWRCAAIFKLTQPPSGLIDVGNLATLIGGLGANWSDEDEDED
jgi:hypothetical protein